MGLRDHERTCLQLCLVLFVLTASIGALLLVGRITSDEVCDYTGAVDTCSEQNIFRTVPQLEAAERQFEANWLIMAQELRNESEIQKCEIEQKLIDDLIALHRREAEKIIEKCHKDFQECVFAGRGTTTTTTMKTTSTVRTTTAFVAATTVTTTLGAGCLQQALQSGSTPNFIECVTDPGNEPPYPAPPSTTTTTTAFYDCTLCDKFCAAFNWSQLDPQYAALMGYSNSEPCTARVCPWRSVCTAGPPSLNLHPNCSAKGCPCFRAQCITTTTTTTSSNAAGGRRLTDERWQTELERMESEAGVRRAQAAVYTTTTTTEDLINNTECTCKPGYVTTVLVGRPYRVFFGDPAQMGQIPRLLRVAGGRKLNDPSLQAELAQGVEVTMEEEIIENRERTFDCRQYFSDKFKYVYPKSVGDENSLAAFFARLHHADLGCGYTGSFKVRCVSGGNGTCAYKVDISTCVPPDYGRAVDSCFYEEPGNIASSPSMPFIADWLETEDIDNTTELPQEFQIPPPVTSEQCCAVHVSSECVMNREFPDYGTKNGSWEPERSHKKETPFFQTVFCSQQAPLQEHTCPRVKIKRLPGTLGNGMHQADLNPECFRVCNVTSVNEELNRSCYSTVEATTRILQENALRAKINSMKAYKDQLRSWSRSHWPRVLQSKHVVDCVQDELPKRFNRLGYPKRRSDSFDKLQMRYECRIHGCTPHQCLTVTKPCPIDHMDSSLESTCGPFGDDRTFQCVDKVEIVGTGIGFPIGYVFFACSFLCLASTFVIIIRSFLAKNAKVAPYDGRLNAVEPPRESLALEDTAQTDAKQDTPPQLALIDREWSCASCGHMNDSVDKCCTECGAKRVEPTMVSASPAPLNPSRVSATSPNNDLRATANSPSNESRIQPFTPNGASQPHGFE